MSFIKTILNRFLSTFFVFFSYCTTEIIFVDCIWSKTLLYLYRYFLFRLAPARKEKVCEGVTKIRESINNNTTTAKKMIDK